MDPMAEQSAALGASVGAWAGLQQAAGSGELRMEPGVAEQCAKHCDDLIKALNGHYMRAQQLAFIDGLGECRIGNALEQKFNDKARGTSNSLTSIIRKHQEVLRQMADTYRAGGQAFRTREQANTAVMGG